MAQALVIEIADHRGRMVDRLRLATAPLTIGRGYHCDVILDDAYVDAAHLRIEPNEGGDWIVTDLGSRNGTIEMTTGHFVRQALLQPGQQLKVGRTVIRVVGADHPVPAALPLDGGSRGGLAGLVEPKYVGPIVAGELGLTALSQYLGSSEEQSFAALTTPGVSVLLLCALWAAGWAFTNRIVSHRFRFLSHLGWTVLIGVGYTVVAVALEWLEFLSPTIDWSLLQVALGTGIFATLLVGHFQLLTEWTAARQWRIALSVAGAGLVIVGIIGQSDLLNDGESPRDVDRSALKPITTTLIPTTSTDRFFRRTEALKANVDDLAGDEVEEATDPEVGSGAADSAR